MTAVPFTKMHGLGNDFVVIDARANALDLSDAQVRAIANRHTGVGCDQLIVIEPARTGLADVFMRIRNADGGEVEACGNATRCVAAVLMDEKGNSHAVIETVAGLLDAESAQSKTGRLISVDMGPANLDWREIPLRQACDTLHVPLAMGPLSDPVATNIGNPHATFFVPDANAIALGELGPKLEHHAMFPERANIGVAQISAENQIRLRVWERGAGITLACGSGACAAVVAAARRGLTARQAEVVLDGGTLLIDWMADNHVLMTGPVAISFSGTLDRSLLT
jgi:diaminopimelate epimerase